MIIERLYNSEHGKWYFAIHFLPNCNNTVGNKRDYKRAEAGLTKEGVSKKLFLPNTRKKYTEEENIKVYLK